MPDSDGRIQRESGLAISKDFLVLIPLLGSGLAITYDVGFFTGFNISYFTFFSLSEHIVFSLEFLPFALLSAFVTGLLIYFAQPILARGRLSLGRRYNFARTYVMPLSIVFWGCIFTYFVRTPIAITIGISISALFLYFVIELESFLGRLAFGCAAAVVTSYWLGYSLSNGLWRPSTDVVENYIERFKTPITTTIETKSNGVVEARLLRSGDRGVHFYNKKTKQITLLRWDEIMQISTSETP